MPESELLTRAVSNVTPKDLAEKKLKSGKKMRLYLGIDPTGAHLHIGHAVPLRKLKAFADAGHEVIFLIGSFTAMIGDPTDREAERERLTKKQVEENFKTYKEQASKVLDFSKIHVRYNHEWLEKLDFGGVVDLASRFTVQQMLDRDMFQKRIADGKPIHVHEFLYPLMVGYDSVVLDVDCELGGNDQYFNMLCGRTLQTAYGKREKFVLTTKLIEGTDGRKMSKTYGNCIYLDDAPSDMYGKVMRVEDGLMPLYFECCTDVPMAEVKKLLAGKPKEAKMHLAREIVALYHGEKAAGHAESEFQNVFSQGGTPEDMPEVSVKKGSGLIDLLVKQKLIASKSEARRLVEQGGIHLNDTPVKSIDAPAEEGIVRVGKRKFLKITLK